MNTKVNIAAVIVAVIFLCAAASQVSQWEADKSERAVITETHVIAVGETLWDIAREYCPEDMDIREYIDDITTRNRLNGAVIHEGETIEILTYKEAEQ